MAFHSTLSVSSAGRSSEVIEINALSGANGRWDGANFPVELDATEVAPSQFEATPDLVCHGGDVVTVSASLWTDTEVTWMGGTFDNGFGVALRSAGIQRVGGGGWGHTYWAQWETFGPVIATFSGGLVSAGGPSQVFPNYPVRITPFVAVGERASTSDPFVWPAGGTVHFEGSFEIPDSAFMGQPYPEWGTPERFIVLGVTTWPGGASSGPPEYEQTKVIAVHPIPLRRPRRGPGLMR